MYLENSAVYVRPTTYQLSDIVLYQNSSNKTHSPPICWAKKFLPLQFLFPTHKKGCVGETLKQSAPNISPPGGPKTPERISHETLPLYGTLHNLRAGSVCETLKVHTGSNLIWHWCTGSQHLLFYKAHARWLYWNLKFICFVEFLFR